MKSYAVFQFRSEDPNPNQWKPRRSLGDTLGIMLFGIILGIGLTVTFLGLP